MSDRAPEPPVPAPPRTPRPPAAPPRPAAEVYAHTLITSVAILGGVVLVALGRLRVEWWMALTALGCGWLAPAMVLQLLAAYSRAVYAPPPGSQAPTPTPAPVPEVQLPPPGSLALLLALVALGRALVTRGGLALAAVGAR